MGSSTQRCPYCRVENVVGARNCHTCGRELPSATSDERPPDEQAPPPQGAPPGWPYAPQPSHPQQPPPWAQPPPGAPWGQPPPGPPWAQPPPGAPWGSPPQQYEYVYGQPGGPPRVTTNGMAVASLVLGITGALGCCYGVLSILALVFGYVARSQIDASMGRQSGRGLAIAGIVLGYAGIAFAVAWLLFVFAVDQPFSPVPLR